MKTKYILAILVLIPFTGIKAQQPLLTMEDSLKVGNSYIPAISINIPEVSYDKTLKAWTRDLQSGTKSKIQTENGVMSIFGAIKRDINPTPMNVYSRLTEVDSALQLVVSFEMKKDQYIEKNNNEADFNKAENFLKEFAKAQYIEVAKDQADREDKILRDLQKELSSLEREKTRLQRSIQNNKSTINDANEAIAIQTNELNIVNGSLVNENSQLSTMEEGPAKKEKEVAIKDLEKRKKKAANALESAQNKIDRANRDIDDANAEIPKNEKQQEQVRNRIADQEAVYEKYADKLKKIKSY